MTGGHGELFVQTFDRKKLTATGPILNLPPAGRGDQGRCSAGRRKRRRGAGRGAPFRRGAAALADGQPALRLARTAPHARVQADLRPRARRARPAGGVMATQPQASGHSPACGPAARRSRRGDADHEQRPSALFRRGLDPVAVRRNPADARRRPDDRRETIGVPVGFSLVGRVADEAELLLIAVDPASSGAASARPCSTTSSPVRRDAGRAPAPSRSPRRQSGRRNVSRRRLCPGRPAPQLLSRARRRAFDAVTLMLTD